MLKQEVKTFIGSLELGLCLHYPRIVCSDCLTSYRNCENLNILSRLEGCIP